MLGVGGSRGVLGEAVIVRGVVLFCSPRALAACRDEVIISLMRLPGRSLRTVWVSRSLRFLGLENATIISLNPSWPRRCLL
jgi:hypothetical protein